MPRRLRSLAVLLGWFCAAALRPAAAQSAFGLGDQPVANPDAAATVVVYNSKDPESKNLAYFYAEKRGIPTDQVLGLPCSAAEEISRTEYDDTIAEPLRRAFTANFWWKLRPADDAIGPVTSNRIRYVVLMRGMPLKVAPTASYEGDRPNNSSPVMEHNEASVDSEITVLALRQRQISGAFNNPYYRSFTTILEAHQPEIMLVTRLDGPSATVVRQMIVDSLAAEKTGLRGLAYIDARGITTPGFKEGDDWLLSAANSLQRGGVPVILDKGEQLFPTGYPMRQAALYFGWYAGDVTASFVGGNFRFRPGAIACHIHSFSAATLRDAQTHWVGPLLNLGAAAAIGNVYEPYLGLTSNLDVFTERLRAGFTFAESAYASERVLSWMSTFVGDPLYRPYPIFPAEPGGPESAEWDQYQEGARKFFTNVPAGEAALKVAATKGHSGLLWEGLGLLEIRANNAKTAIGCFEQARKAYSNPEDILRAAIHQIIQLRGTGRVPEAEAVAKLEAKAHKGSPAIGVLQLLVPGAFPPPAAPAAPR